jgi:surfeit locus 1 family protein
MTRRFPVVATIVVALAIAAMLALGIWQLQRLGQKEAALRLYAANLEKPPVAFPASATGDSNLFRRSGGNCLQVVRWSKEGGRAADGTVGYRQLAHCRTGAEGPGMTVDVGVTTDPNYRPVWPGSAVTGTITHAADHRALIATAFDTAPQTLILIADTAAPGLHVTQKPGLGSVPNNHFAYAMQWFLFAAVAAIIYALALRRRMRVQK